MGAATRPRPVFAIPFLILAVLPLVALAGESADSRARCARGERLLEERKWSEAQAVFEDLLARDPEHYGAYPHYWRALVLEKEAETLRAAVRAALDRFDTIPRRKRSEEFYAAYLRGCGILKDTNRGDAIRNEAILKFPRGPIAQGRRYREAAKAAEEDPVRGEALLRAFVDEFRDDPGSVSDAALARLRVIEKHPELFDAGSLLEAASWCEALYRRDRDAGRQSGAFWYVVATRAAARALARRAPAESLKYAARGLAVLEESWPTSEGLEESERVTFWPWMLRAYVSSADWAAARRTGAALVRAVESGALPDGVLEREVEAGARLDFARALEEQEAIEEAREQIGLAVVLEASLRQDLDAFRARHPLEGAPKKKFEAMIAAKTAAARKRQADRARRSLMATEIESPAPPFRAVSLAGRPVTLGDFRGKAVVMSMWATWCVPCHYEMQHLEAAFRKYRKNPKVAFAAVSVDWEKEKVAPFVREKKFTLPILIAEGDFEKAYDIQSIPQILILDPKGRIRFRQVDVLPEERFHESLDWMIEAALR